MLTYSRYFSKKPILIGVVLLALLAIAFGGLLKFGSFIPGSSVEQSKNSDEISLANLFPKTEEYDFDLPLPGSYRLNSIKPTPDGQLLDHSGKQLDLQTVLAGKISLVSFVYLNCNDENGCPVAFATLFGIHDKSAKAPFLKKDVQLVTISFDPERDTPEALTSYAIPAASGKDAAKKLDWFFLTAENQQYLKPVLDGFGQSVNATSDPEIINHLLRMYLVDRDGTIRNIYGLGMIDPRLLLTDIETLLLEDVAS